MECRDEDEGMQFPKRLIDEYPELMDWGLSARYGAIIGVMKYISDELIAKTPTFLWARFPIFEQKEIFNLHQFLEALNCRDMGVVGFYEDIRRVIQRRR